MRDKKKKICKLFKKITYDVAVGGLILTVFTWYISGQLNKPNEQLHIKKDGIHLNIKEKPVSSTYIDSIKGVAIDTSINIKLNTEQGTISSAYIYNPNPVNNDNKYTELSKGSNGHYRSPTFRFYTRPDEFKNFYIITKNDKYTNKSDAYVVKPLFIWVNSRYTFNDHFGHQEMTFRGNDKGFVPMYSAQVIEPERLLSMNSLETDSGESFISNHLSQILEINYEMINGKGVFLSDFLQDASYPEFVKVTEPLYRRYSQQESKSIKINSKKILAERDKVIRDLPEP